MSDQKDIYEAGRTIRAYLPDLLDSPADAGQVDAALASLLSEEDGDIEDQILEQLEQYDATAEWTAAFLEYGIPPELASLGERGYAEAPGHGEAVRTPKYACPEGDFVWYRHAVGQSPPRCPTHGKLVELVVGS